jgi:hypothetical protein
MPFEQNNQTTKQKSDSLGVFVKWAKNIAIGILLLLGVLVVYRIYSFLTGGGIAMGTVRVVWSMFWWMLKKVFFATLPYLIPPILIFVVIHKLSANKIIRFFAGLGSLYLFYMLSGNITFSLDGALNLIKLAFQLYFLILLVIPDSLTNVAGVAACAVGSIAVYIFPDLPGSADDIGAICTLITMVFAYMNTLAMLVKRFTASILQQGKTGSTAPRTRK